MINTRLNEELSVAKEDFEKKMGNKVTFNEEAEVREIPEIDEQLKRKYNEGPEVGRKLETRENPILRLFHWVSQTMSNFVTPIKILSNMKWTGNLGFENGGPKQWEGLAQKNKTIDQISIKAGLRTLTWEENIGGNVKRDMISAIKQSVLDQAKELGVYASYKKGGPIIKFGPPITKEQGKQLRETAEENTGILLKYIKRSGELDTKTKDDFTKALQEINGRIKNGEEKDRAIAWQARHVDISNIGLEGVTIGDNSEQGSHTLVS